MATATRKPEMVGTVWTASASLMDSSGKVIARCIDTPNAIAKALMEMPRAKVVKSLEGTHGREHWESRMKSWNNAKSGLIKLRQTWQMTQLQPSQLQSYADAITQEYGVPRIPIKVTDRHLKGLAVYNTWKKKGEKRWHPKNILIGDWEIVSTHPGEMLMRLSHELAHHILNMKRGSLAHSSEHGNLEDKIGFRLSRKIKEVESSAAIPKPPPKPAKEPWEMTQEEYESLYGKPSKSTTLTGGFSPHREAVHTAVNQGKPVPAEVLKDYPELGKKEATVKDVTPKGYGPTGEGEIVSPQIQKRKGETLDEAIAREVGYQIDNNRVKLTEDRDGWKATVTGLTDEKPHVIRAYKKQQVLNEVWKYLNPSYVEPEPKAQKPTMIVGEQAGAFGVPQKVHTQKSTGKAVTASMEDYGKLQKARAEAAPEKEVAKEIFGTLSHEDANELIAGLDLRVDALEGRIDEGNATLESIKESLDPKIAKLTELIPTTKEGRSEITHITKGKYKKIWGKEPPASIVSKGKVRWEYALDTIAQELHLEGKAQSEGKAPDEYLKGLIEDAKDTKELISATKAEIESDESTLKALDKLKDTIKARTGKITSGPLLQELAKAPKVKPTAFKPKPEVRAKVMVAAEAQKLIDRIQRSRSPRAIAIDNSILAKKVVPPKKVELWAKNPNRYDIRGVDTPSRGRIVAGVAYGDKGKRRLSRQHHKGWRRVKFT